MTPYLTFYPCSLWPDVQKQASCCCIQIPRSPASGGLSSSLIFCILLKHFLTHCGRIFLICNSSWGHVFQWSPTAERRASQPQDAHWTHFLFWCFVFQLLSLCWARSSCPFWLPVYFACGSSPSADDLKFFIFWMFSKPVWSCKVSFCCLHFITALLCAAHILYVQALFFHSQFALTHLSSASWFL